MDRPGTSVHADSRVGTAPARPLNGFALSSGGSAVFQWAAFVGSPSRVPERSRPQYEALNVLWTRWAAFRSRPFPYEWAKVVNGVGLATLSMRADKCFNTLFA